MTRNVRALARFGHGWRPQRITQFFHNLRIVRGVPPGRPIDVPIAVCVSKMDIWPIADEKRNDAAHRAFIAEMLSSGPTHGEATLNVILQRSQSFLRHRPLLFPDWQIENQLNAVVPGNFEFCPMSSVGVNEFAETDLRDRTIAPFGVLEPLLWLLHRHGVDLLPE